MPRALISFVGVGADQVEVELVSVHFGKEFSTTGEVFEIEELVFFQTVHGFHIALVGVCGGWNAHVLAVAEGFREIAFEFAAKTELAEALRSCAKAQKSRPLRISRAVYWMAGKCKR